MRYRETVFHTPLLIVNPQLFQTLLFVSPLDKFEKSTSDCVRDHLEVADVKYVWIDSFWATFGMRKSCKVWGYYIPQILNKKQNQQLPTKRRRGLNPGMSVNGVLPWTLSHSSFVLISLMAVFPHQCAQWFTTPRINNHPLVGISVIKMNWFICVTPLSPMDFNKITQFVEGGATQPSWPDTKKYTSARVVDQIMVGGPIFYTTWSGHICHQKRLLYFEWSPPWHLSIVLELFRDVVL